jgi:hypothetical protein
MRALMGATIARTLMDQKPAPRARPRRRRRGRFPLAHGGAGWLRLGRRVGPARTGALTPDPRN